MRLTLILAVGLLTACAKAPQQAHIDPCFDPCAAIGWDGGLLDLNDPKRQEKDRRQCEDLRRQKHWSPCSEQAAKAEKP